MVIDPRSAHALYSHVLHLIGVLGFLATYAYTGDYLKALFELSMLLSIIIALTPQNERRA